MTIFKTLSRRRLEETCEGLRVLAAEREKKIEAMQNHITFLSENAQKWSRKFRDPVYRVPEKIIRQMERETEEYKERTEAELIRLRSQKAELINRVISFEAEEEDKFGDPDGIEGVSFDLAGSHSACLISDDDRRIVDEEIAIIKQELQRGSKAAGRSG